MRLVSAICAAALLPACAPQAPEPPEPPAPPAAPEGPEPPAASVTPSDAQSVPGTAGTSTGPVVCKPEESTVFSCDLANGKRVAVCGAGEWVGHYRYGGDKLELELAGGEFADVMYSGGGENQIAFDNNAYRYIVFSRMVRTNFTPDEPNYPAISDGVLVLRNGEVVNMQLCQGAELKPVDTNLANAIWERNDELFTDETIRADPEWAQE